VSSPDPFTVRGKRDRAVLELLYGTAIRVGECERLDLRDVDLLRGQLFVRLGKGRKDRVVPLVGQAAAVLDVYLKDARPELVHDPREQALFLTRRGTRLPVKRVQDLVRSHAKAAGITVRVTPYTLHTAARPTSCRTAPTYDTCRSSSATRVSRRPRSTPTSPPRTCAGPSRKLTRARGPGGAGGKIRPS